MKNNVYLWTYSFILFNSVLTWQLSHIFRIFYEYHCSSMKMVNWKRKQYFCLEQFHHSFFVYFIFSLPNNSSKCIVYDCLLRIFWNAALLCFNEMTGCCQLKWTQHIFICHYYIKSGYRVYRGVGETGETFISTTPMKMKPSFYFC